MTPARWPRPDPLEERLLLVDPAVEAFADARMGDLAEILRAGDLLVVNDAATLPASLAGSSPTGRPIEVRLAGERADGTWWAVLFGEGDWRRTTEERPAPEPLTPGDRIVFEPAGSGVVAPTGDPGCQDRGSPGGASSRSRSAEIPEDAVTDGRGRRDHSSDVSSPTGDRSRTEGANARARETRLAARVESVSAISPRLVALRFDLEGAPFWSALYAIGRPVQYSYLLGPLELWHVQTHYASRPRAVEMPSAGRPLTWSLLQDLALRGVPTAYITHAAGLSSTGDTNLDAALPLPERFEIPEATVAAIERTRRRGGRVVAVGTTVVRALEGCAAVNGGRLISGEGITNLVIGRGFRARVVDGLLTGLHEPAASHFALIQAFAPGALVREAYTHAEREEYRHHEFGDSCLLLPGILGAVRGSGPVGAEMAIRG